MADIQISQAVPIYNSANVVHVSKDAMATDTRGTLSKYSVFRPFATIQAAITAAVAGDCVEVDAGTYTEQVTAKVGVPLKLDPNAIVTFNDGIVLSASTSADSDLIIVDGGQFIRNDVVDSGGADCVDLLADAGRIIMLNSIIRHIEPTNVQDPAALFVNGTGTSQIYVDIPEATSLGGRGVEVSGGNAIIKVGRIYGERVAIDLNNITEKLVIESPSIVSNDESVISIHVMSDGDDGRVDFNGCNFSSLSSNILSADDVSATSSLTLTFTGCTFGGFSGSLDGSATVGVTISATFAGCKFLVAPSFNDLTVTGIYTDEAGNQTIDGSSGADGVSALVLRREDVPARRIRLIPSALGGGWQFVGDGETGFFSGFGAAVNWQVVDFGINASQVGGRNNASVGGLFRMDTRGSLTFLQGGMAFSVIGYATGGAAELTRLIVSLQDGRTFLCPNGGGLFQGGEVFSGDKVLTNLSPPEQIYTGAGNTVTLPAVTGNTWQVFNFKNRGSGILVIQRAGADQIYETVAVTSINLLAGAAVRLVNDGTFFNVE